MATTPASPAPRLRILSWNCSGLTQVLFEELKLHLRLHPCIQVVCLQETHRAFLNEWTADGWTFIHSAAAKAHQGGVLLGFRDTFCSKESLRWQEVHPGRMLHVRCFAQDQHLDFIGLYQHVLPFDSKELEKALVKRRQLWGKLDTMRQHPQYAYRKGASTSDALMRAAGHCSSVRKLLQRHRSDHTAKILGEATVPLVGGLMCGIDLQKAFDAVRELRSLIEELRRVLRTNGAIACRHRVRIYKVLALFLQGTFVKSKGESILHDSRRADHIKDTPAMSTLTRVAKASLNMHIQRRRDFMIGAHLKSTSPKAIAQDQLDIDISAALQAAYPGQLQDQSPLARRACARISAPPAPSVAARRLQSGGHTLPAPDASWTLLSERLHDRGSGTFLTQPLLDLLRYQCNGSAAAGVTRWTFDTRQHDAAEFTATLLDGGAPISLRLRPTSCTLQVLCFCTWLEMLMQSNRRFGQSLSIMEKAWYLVTTVDSLCGNVPEEFFLEAGCAMLGHRIG